MGYGVWRNIGRLQPVDGFLVTVLPVAYVDLPVRLVRRGAQLVAGCLAVGTGLAVLLRCGLGLDPYRSLLAGVGRLTGLSFGTTNIVFGLLLVTLAWWPGRVRPRVATVGQPVLVGLTVNALLPHLADVSGGAADRATVAGLALLVIGVGGGLYLGADLGATSFDAVILALHRAFPGRSFTAVYTTALLAAVAVASLVGGPVGLVTLVAMVALGPLTSAVRRWSDKGPIRPASPGATRPLSRFLKPGPLAWRCDRRAGRRGRPGHRRRARARAGA